MERHWQITDSSHLDRDVKIVIAYVHIFLVSDFNEKIRWTKLLSNKQKNTLPIHCTSITFTLNYKVECIAHVGGKFLKDEN